MGIFRHLKSAPFTWLMASTILAVFAVTWVTRGEDGAADLFSAGLLETASFHAGDCWRLLSSSLVHRDWNHVLSNTAGLIVVGLLLEPKLGTWRTTLIYVLGEIGSSVAILVLCIEGGGASGAIYALMGGYLSRPLRQRGGGEVAVGPGWLVAAWWVGETFDFGTDYSDVAHAAHLAGLIVGLCLGAFFDDREGQVLGWSRPRRLAAAALVSLGLIAALAPDPRWILGWNLNVAKRLERAEGYLAARPYWEAIEEVADPRRHLDAVFIEKAARFRVRGDDFIGARELLNSVAPTLREAEVYRDIGFLLAYYEPTDEHAALRIWRKAAELNPDMPEVLDAIAKTIVSSDDSTIGRPEEARELASRAVALDRMRRPKFLRTLAWAHYLCGDTDRAIVWMRLAVHRSPEHGETYASDLAVFEGERDAKVSMRKSRTNQN